MVATGGIGLSAFGLDPLTRLDSADETASSSHPLPQGRPFQNWRRELERTPQRGEGRANLKFRV
jgi:hypothetical protein